MVFSSCVRCCSSFIKNSPKRMKRRFMDSLRIHVNAGSGGMGFPKYGGRGGNGGNVYAVGKEGITLKDVVNLYPAKRVKSTVGGDSHSKRIMGLPGEDTIIETPLGVTILHETGKKIGEINKDGEKILIAQGGLGGFKDTGYCGLRGENGTVIFDLKLIADIGLVGFPNAGKSTLLSAVSNASPKIASYPFTTLHPQLGNILYPDLRSITIADLPGLIEGAHINIGLGHRFLKHVERTSLFALVVDVGGFRLSQNYKSRSCLETIVLLNKELELYKEDLLNIPSMLIINKLDKDRGSEIFKEVQSIAGQIEDIFPEVPEEYRPHRPINFHKIIGMSAKDKNTDEIESVKNAFREILDAEIVEESLNKELSLIKEINVKYNECRPTKML